MKSIPTLKNLLLTGLLTTSFVVSGCLEKDLYEPNTDPAPSEKDYFDFQLRGDVKLSVNYNMPGFKAYIEIYDQNPMAEDGVTKKKDITPVYTAFTDENATLNATVYIPTSVGEAYLYTKTWGLPHCVKMNVSQEGLSYETTTEKQRAARAAEGYNFSGVSFPYSLYDLDVNTKGWSTRYDNLYSICKWGDWGTLEQSYLSMTTTVDGEEKLGSMIKRVQTAFENNPGQYITKDSKATNITTTQGMTLDVVIIDEKAMFANVFGYYYYKKSEEARLDVESLNKYMIFPNASLNDDYGGKDHRIMHVGNTVRLKYFENGVAKDEFPADYVVGWFMIRDGYIRPIMGTSGVQLNGIRDGIFRSGDNTTNVGANGMARFVSFYDEKSNTRILGFEDENVADVNQDFSDLLFFVKSNKKIEGGQPLPTPKPEIGTEVLSGTLCFEDTWPSGGDYDMNDVAVKYNRTINYDGTNHATKIIEAFTFAQRDDAAVYNNFFGYQVNKMGTVALLPEGCVKEEGSQSIVITKSAKSVIGQTFTIERTFGKNEIAKDQLIKDFNPFIIVKSYSTENRVEVHLPKSQPTAYANKNLNNTQDDAYYVDKNGKYPYAIEIPASDFELSPEKTALGITYPSFEEWVKSNGSTSADWFK